MQVGAASAAGTLLPLLARAQGSGPIKVGAFGPMSGNAAAQGQSLRQGVEMAAKAKNASPGSRLAVKPPASSPWSAAGNAWMAAH